MIDRTLVDMTPDLAKRYLAHNDHNRPLQLLWVRELALRMWVMLPVNRCSFWQILILRKALVIVPMLRG